MEQCLRAEKSEKRNGGRHVQPNNSQKPQSIAAAGESLMASDGQLMLNDQWSMINDQ